MTTWQTLGDEFEIETADLARLAFEYRDCSDKRGLDILMAEFRRRDALQAELIATLRDVSEELDRCWRSDIQGRNSPPDCPYDSYVKVAALLARFKS